MGKGKGNRLFLLDELRGFAIICMVLFHAFFTASEMFGWPVATKLLHFFTPAEPYFAALFILISGISCNLSHSNLKRGLILLGISAAMTIVTYSGRFVGIYGIVIWFGILHLLAVCILFVALTGRGLKKIHPFVAILLCAFLFYFTMNVELYNGARLNFFSQTIALPPSLYETDILCPFGFYSRDFFSADYFPLLPWLFMFLIGYYLGMYVKKGKFPKFFYNKHIRPFAFVGKYTLWIYIIHQPVIYAVCYAVSFIKSHI